MDRLFLLIPLILGGLLVGFGCFFVRLSWLARSFERQIAKHGLEAEAVITDHRKVHVDLRNGGGRNDYYLSFQYAVPAAEGPLQKITHETQVSADDFERYNPGDRLLIRYLPDRPEEVVVSSGVQEQSVPYFRNAGIAAIGAGALLILISMAAWLRWPV